MKEFLCFRQGEMCGNETNCNKGGWGNKVHFHQVGRSIMSNCAVLNLDSILITQEIGFRTLSH